MTKEEVVEALAFQRAKLTEVENSLTSIMRQCRNGEAVGRINTVLRDLSVIQMSLETAEFKESGRGR